MQNRKEKIFEVKSCRYPINYLTLRQKSTVVNIQVSQYALSSLLLVAAATVVMPLLEYLLPFDSQLFTYPLNVVLMVLWLFIVWEIYRRRGSSAVARYLLSRAATVTAIALLAVGCIVMGLQREPATESYLFMAMTLFVMTQLLMVTLRGWRSGGGISWVFTLCHVGLLLVLIAGFWGAPDTEVLRARVTAEPSREFYYEDGSRGVTEYTISLTEVRVEHYPNGAPLSYEADIKVDDNEVTLRVNHPYKVRVGEHIYLTSVDEKQKDMCIVQLVRQPWQRVSLVGILLLIGGAVLILFRGPRG